MYTIMTKSMAEAVFGYNGFNRYPKGSVKVFPAVGLGWNIYKEQFLKIFHG